MSEPFTFDDNYQVQKGAIFLIELDPRDYEVAPR